MLLFCNTDIDKPHLFLCKLFHTFDGIIYGIPKQRININGIHEEQLLPIDHTVHGNISCLTDQALL